MVLFNVDESFTININLVNGALNGKTYFTARYQVFMVCCGTKTINSFVSACDVASRVDIFINAWL